MFLIAVQKHKHVDICFVTIINLEGWNGVGGGREIQEGGDICIPMANSYQCLAEMTQYCKAMILQLKINKFK